MCFERTRWCFFFIYLFIKIIQCHASITGMLLIDGKYDETSNVMCQKMSSISNLRILTPTIKTVLECTIRWLSHNSWMQPAQYGLWPIYRPDFWPVDAANEFRNAWTTDSYTHDDYVLWGYSDVMFSYVLLFSYWYTVAINERSIFRRALCCI